MSRGPRPEDLAFQGYWEQRGMIRVPIIPDDDPYDLFPLPPCVVCGEPSLGSKCTPCKNAARVHESRNQYGKRQDHA